MRCYICDKILKVEEIQVDKTTVKVSFLPCPKCLEVVKDTLSEYDTDNPDSLEEGEVPYLIEPFSTE